MPSLVDCPLRNLRGSVCSLQMSWRCAGALYHHVQRYVGQRLTLMWVWFMWLKWTVAH